MTDLVFHFSDGNVIRVPIDDAAEVTIGRDPASTVRLDSDLVSRKHAQIRVNVAAGGQRTLTLADLDSTNGTWLRGRRWGAAKRVLGSENLAVEDEIEFGKGGPKATVDVDPRGWHDLPRTDLYPAEGAASAATKMAPAADAGNGGWGGPETVINQPPDVSGGAPAARSEGASVPPIIIPPKVGIGQQTLERALDRERRAAGKKWLIGAASALAALVVVGAVLFWYTTRTGEALKTEVASLSGETEKLGGITKDLDVKTASLEARVDDKSPEQIVELYGNAVVLIRTSWTLQDEATGMQVFHRFTTSRDGNFFYPSYVELPDGRIVRWLITDPEEMGARTLTNWPVTSSVRGTGFLVSSDGLILTAKHVAAGWHRVYEPDYENERPSFNPEGLGALYQYNSVFTRGVAMPKADVRQPHRLVKISELKAARLANGDEAFERWIPSEGGILFNKKWATSMLGSEARYGADRPTKTDFQARDRHAVTFRGRKIDMQARVLSVSMRNDVALIKVDNPAVVELAGGKPGGGQAAAPSLPVVRLASAEANVAPAGRVTVLGYIPGPGERIVATGSSELLGGATTYRTIPELSFFVGNMSKRVTASDDAVARDSRSFGSGDYYEMTIDNAASGISGSPVFNSSGEVIGIFIYTLRDERLSGAVPIEFAWELIGAGSAIAR